MPTFQRVKTPFNYSAAVVEEDTVYLGLHRGSGGSFAEQPRGTFDGLTGTLDEIGLTTANPLRVRLG